MSEFNGIAFNENFVKSYNADSDKRVHNWNRCWIH